MQAVSWFTVIGSILLSSPMMLWLAGVPPAAMAVLHVAAVALTVRLLLITAIVSGSRRDTTLVGGVAGAVGALVSQILLHTPTGHASLAVAFAGYGWFGAAMYRWDALNRWWPWVVVLLGTGGYGLLGWAAYAASRRTRSLQGF